MKYLLSGIHAHYKFHPSIRSGDVENIVIINSLGKHVFDHETAPLDKYANLKEVMEQFGQLNTFFEYLLSFQKSRLFLSLDVDDNHRLTTGFLRAVYPHMSKEMIHWILMQWVRFEKVHITSNRRWPDSLRQAYTDLPLPTQAQVDRYDMYFTGQDALSADLRHRVGMEFLTAHAYAVDFNPVDTYVQELNLRVEKMIWDTVAGDLFRLRKHALLGFRNLGPVLNAPIEPNREDLDRHLRQVTRSPVFEQIDPIEAGEFIYKNFNATFDFILKTQRGLGEDTSYTEYRRKMIDPTVRLSPEQARQVLEDGPSLGWSRLLTHPATDGFANPTLLDLIPTLDQERLQQFRLDY